MGNADTNNNLLFNYKCVKTDTCYNKGEIAKENCIAFSINYVYLYTANELNSCYFVMDSKENVIDAEFMANVLFATNTERSVA